MKNKLSFEVLCVIMVALVISISANFAASYVIEPHLNKMLMERNITVEDRESGEAQPTFKDLFDDEGDVYEISIQIVIISGFAWFIYFFINKKVVYITEISSDLERIGSGNLEHRIREFGNDELTDLARSINAMSSSLEMHIREERRAMQSEQRLITGISHDLRAPLSAIIGYLYVLKDKQYVYEEERDEYMDIALEKSLRLQSLLDDLLEMASVNEKSMEINTMEIGSRDFFDDVEDYIRYEIDVTCKNIDGVRLVQMENSDFRIYVNNMFILRVVDNLVSNIKKYASAVSVVELEEAENEGYVELRISNECDLKTLENAEKLTERFYKVDDSRTREDSSGLGLNICKGIMERQKGYLDIETDYERKRLVVVLGFKKSLD